MNILIFDDTASAAFMQQYTGNEIHQRQAILTINMSGGGGFEIWQFTSRTPVCYDARFGDLGIFSVKIKCRNIQTAHAHFKSKTLVYTSPVLQSPHGNFHFLVKDNCGNHFDIAEHDSWFRKDSSVCGGVYGACIGVSNMETSIRFYKNLLGFDETVSDVTGTVTDIPQPGQQVYRRVLLRKKKAVNGAFTNLLGDTEIELVQDVNNTSKKIFANRYWGDCGFIHLCFDVTDMDALKKMAVSLGYQFTIDSKDSFAMENAKGRFCYVEDPDGTLIELVETHKIPVLKKLNWYIDLKKRKGQKPLPSWMIRTLGLNKIR